ncbi:MAG TPA: type 4a pilus biogenesis protein PilO [Solimonas sp.]|nr:type 4a pilus biogenesis protein PilO [Solimonas sp.]
MKTQDILTELQNLDPQNPGAWPLYVRIASIVLAAILLVAAGTWFLIKPIYEELETLRGTETGLRKEFEEKQSKVAGLDAYRAQLAEMEKSFGAMLKQLPSRAEVANLLNDISQTRVASSLEEELFQPQPEVAREFYAEIPNRIVVIGTYHEMGNFVSSVAALPRIVTIENVDISGGANKTIGTGVDKTAVLRMTALAKTYRYLDEEEIPKKKGKAGGKKK